MRIKVVRDSPFFPFAYVHVDITVDTDRDDVRNALSAHRLTPLGHWGPHIVNGEIQSFKVPVLIENEHVKPPKIRNRVKK